MLRHRLCEIFHCTLAELDTRITPTEEYQWRIYDYLSPSLGERLDLLAARLCSFIAGDSVEPHEWGKWLEKFIPVTPEERAANIAALLAKFDDVVKPSTTPDKAPIKPGTPTVTTRKPQRKTLNPPNTIPTQT